MATATSSDRTTAKGAHRTVTKAAALAALGGLLFGYDTGVIGGVLPNIADEFHLDSPFSKGLVVAVLLAGAAVGALLAGRLADRLGRRRLVLLTSATFVVGTAVASLAPALVVLLLGRFVIGMGVGAASFGVPLYIGELAPPSRRAAAVAWCRSTSSASPPASW
jgi:MFS family permease